MSIQNILLYKTKYNLLYKVKENKVLFQYIGLGEMKKMALARKGNLAMFFFWQSIHCFLYTSFFFFLIFI